MKNSQSWFLFAEQNLKGAVAEVSLVRQGENRFTLTFPPTHDRVFHLASVPVSEEGVGPGLKSGRPSTMMEILDERLRDFRKNDRRTPLVAFLRPEAYWTRGPAWTLGEYLAERDLLLWVDLLHLHPERVVAWCRLLADCGLACARTFVSLSDNLQREDLPILSQSGVWLLRFGKSSESGSLEQC